MATSAIIRRGYTFSRALVVTRGYRFAVAVEAPRVWKLPSKSLTFGAMTPRILEFRK